MILEIIAVLLLLNLTVLIVLGLAIKEKLNQIFEGMWRPRG